MYSSVSTFAAAALLALAGSASAAGTQAGSSVQSFEIAAGDANAGVDFGTAPPSSVIVLHGGKEWIWAAPCSEGADSCGAPTPHSGFNTPTAADWGTWADRSALVAAFNDPQLCGSPWMSSIHNHCDSSDLVNGHIWQAPGLCDPNYFNGCEAGTTETFYVRSVGAIPEPETYALMIAGLSVVGWMTRRRQRGATA